MTRARLLERMRTHRYAVQSSVAADGRPQSAVVGVAVTDAFEIVFDTLASTRKCVNLIRDPRVAVVMGSLLPDASWGLQIEGIADQPAGDEQARLVQHYFSVFPDGLERQQWPGITYFRVRPTWIRSLDYAPVPPEIVEIDAEALQRLSRPLPAARRRRNYMEQPVTSQTAIWISRLLQRELEAFERELALFPDDASVWRVVPGITNSAGTLVLHCCGNLQHFIGRVLGGTAYVRDRDAEFSRTGVSRDALREELKTSGAVVQAVLPHVTDEQLAAPYGEAVGGTTMVTGLFLTHLAAHLAFHLGQAGYLRRAVTGDNRSAAPLPLTPLAL